MTKTELAEKLPLPISSPVLDNEMAVIKKCENCHQPLNGKFCANCGQSVDSTLKYFWVVILHLLDDIFSFDSRASRTLWPLIFRPAFLTKEYFAGRRVHYVPPLRLYLFVSIIFFITLGQIIHFAEDKNKKSIKDSIKSSVIQVNEQVKKLESELLIAKKSDFEHEQKIMVLNAKIARYKVYLTDLVHDDPTGKGRRLIELTQEIIGFELKGISEQSEVIDKIEKVTPPDLPDIAGLPELPEKPDDYSSLIKKIKDLKDGTYQKDIETKINLQNSDGSKLTFDFLSTESNNKIHEFIKLIEKKAAKVVQFGPMHLINEATGKLPQLMFVLLPLFAVLLKVLFVFSRRLYMEHLTVALHSHSFIFVMILIGELLSVLEEFLEPSYPGVAAFVGVVTLLCIFWIPIYLFIMQKRVYKQGFIVAFFMYNLIALAYLFLMMITIGIAIVWGLTSI